MHIHYDYTSVFSAYTDKPQKITFKPVLSKSRKAEKSRIEAVFLMRKNQASRERNLCLQLRFTLTQNAAAASFDNHTPCLVSWSCQYEGRVPNFCPTPRNMKPVERNKPRKNVLEFEKKKTTEKTRKHEAIIMISLKNKHTYLELETYSVLQTILICIDFKI
ncbi:unnamed protein product [Ixodes persulcatus]